MHDLNFYATLDKQLESIWMRRKNILVMGDSDLQRNQNICDSGIKLISVLKKYNLVNVIKQPTRVIIKSETLIDLSITSVKNKITRAGVFDTCIADHKLNYVVMKLFKARVPAPKIQLVYDWKRSNVDDFKKEIAMTP